MRHWSRKLSALQDEDRKTKIANRRGKSQIYLANRNSQVDVANRNSQIYLPNRNSQIAIRKSTWLPSALPPHKG